MYTVYNDSINTIKPRDNSVKCLTNFQKKLYCKVQTLFNTTDDAEIKNS